MMFGCSDSGNPGDQSRTGYMCLEHMHGEASHSHGGAVQSQLAILIALALVAPNGLPSFARLQRLAHEHFHRRKGVLGVGCCLVLCLLPCQALTLYAQI